MAINIHCPVCNSDFAIKHKACPTCKTPVSKAKKFRVVVSTPEGKRITRIVEGNITIARTVEGKIKAEVAQKKHLNIHKAPMISDCWNKYLEWAKENKKSWRDDKDRWKKHIEPYVGEKRMDEIAPRDVHKIIQRMYDGHTPRGNPYAPSTIKQVLVLIKRVYNWAIDLELYLGSNPASKIKPPKVDNQKTEFLDNNELERLLRILDQWENRLGALMVKYTLMTGVRQSEVFKLKWSDVDMEKGYMSLLDPKGKPTTIAISKEAISVLAEAKANQPIEGCEWVFPNKYGQKRVSFNNTWYRIRAAAGIPKKFRFHDLRHTFATYLASSGKVDMYTLQKMLNHQTPQMTQRYAHLMDEALRRGAEVAGDIFSNNKKRK